LVQQTPPLKKAEELATISVWIHSIFATKRVLLTILNGVLGGGKAAILPTGVSALQFATQQSPPIQLRNARVAPTALRKSIFSL
jgi:hypothetical protein